MGRLRDWLQRSRNRGGRRAARGGAASRALPFKLKYSHFRELLAANDQVLELIAEVEDRLARLDPSPPEGLRPQVERGMLSAFIMVKNLNRISADRYRGLYQALERVHGEVAASLGARPETRRGPPVVRLEAATRADADLLGAKMANLAEVRNRVGLPVPDGFVVTAPALDQVLARSRLREQIATRLDGCGAAPEELAAVSAAIQAAVREAGLPDGLLLEVGRATAELAARRGGQLRLAVRSSAIGEDGAASYAGQYQTVLNVRPSEVPRSLLQVLASLYGPGALAYQRQHGLGRQPARMAVGCIELVDALTGGILFTRDPTRPEERHLIVEAVPGQGAGAADGSITPDRFVVAATPSPRILERTLGVRSHMLLPTPAGGLARVPLPPEKRRAPSLGDERLLELCRIGLRLEEHFGGPQDVEWALDLSGRLVVLQTRPLACGEPQPAPEVSPVLLEGYQVLVRDGATACAGVGAGVVVRIEHDADLDRVPADAVLVARHSSPSFARVMSRVRAIVTEVGGQTGHMAIIARELGVPTIVGAASAATLVAGSEITVDATRGLVLRGRVEALLRAAPRRPARSSAAAGSRRALLEGIARHLCPLHLTDPDAPDFDPDGCRSLHDVTRFAHEKIFAEMFQLGDDVKPADEARAVKLAGRLPIEVFIFDLGSALRPEVGERREVELGDLSSVPLRAFAAGLTDARIRWDRPRPVSARGFLSVVGESMLAPPPARHTLGRRSFAIASDNYLNFSTRAGYHFSTLDTYCGPSLNRNYIHFRFAGGAAAEPRRVRRASFVAGVLRRLGFAVQSRGDLVTGRLQKYPSQTILRTLESMGRLTLCTRQLDMLMDSDGVVEAFIEAFLGEDFAVFG